MTAIIGGIMKAEPKKHKFVAVSRWQIDSIIVWHSE